MLDIKILLFVSVFYFASKVQNAQVYSLAHEIIDEEDFAPLFDALSSRLTMTDILAISCTFGLQSGSYFSFFFQATLARDALSKALYSQVFDYLVKVRSLGLTSVNTIFCFK